MTRIKGRLLRDKPSKVSQNGKSESVRVTMPVESGLNPWTYVYQKPLDNGIIMIIPENVYDYDKISKDGIIKKSKVIYNGISGSVRIVIASECGLVAEKLVLYERLDNDIILIIPEKVYDNTRSN